MDTRTVLEREAQQFKLRPDAFERMRRRRDRKRRNQRIAAGVVGIAVFVAAIWIVTSVGSLDRSETPPTPGGAGPSMGVRDTPGVDYLLDLNTGAKSPLPDAITRLHDAGGVVGQYAASPDGSRLAFVKTSEDASKDGNPQIFVAAIDGTGMRQLTHDSLGATSPAWSPDGTTIAYVRSQIGSGNLFLFDIATGESTKIGDTTAASLQFTPDGSSVLLDSHSGLWTVSVAGGKSTRLIEPGPGLNDAGNGSISPDGSMVTYLGGGSPLAPDGSPLTFQGKEITHAGPGRFVSKLDGTGFGLLPGGVSNPAGTWSPDGTRIVCSGEDGNSGGGIIVVDVATGNFTRVAEGRIAIWLDDHTLLVEV